MFEPFFENAKIRQFTVPAQCDVGWNQGVLYWIKPLPDWFDYKALRLRNQEA